MNRSIEIKKIENGYIVDVDVHGSYNDKHYMFTTYADALAWLPNVVLNTHSEYKADEEAKKSVREASQPSAQTS